MSAIGLQALLKPQVDATFALAAQIVRDCIFYTTESNAGTGLLTLAAAVRTGEGNGHILYPSRQRRPEHPFAKLRTIYDL